MAIDSACQATQRCRWPTAPRAKAAHQQRFLRGTYDAPLVMKRGQTRCLQATTALAMARLLSFGAGLLHSHSPRWQAALLSSPPGFGGSQRVVPAHNAPAERQGTDSVVVAPAPLQLETRSGSRWPVILIPAVQSLPPPLFATLWIMWPPKSRGLQYRLPLITA